MNQTHPRCVQCGENPRIMFERYDGPAEYHPLCVECHLDLRGKAYGEAPSQSAADTPKRPISLPELLIVKTRFVAIGALIFSILQLPLLFLKGPISAVIIQSVLVAIAAPWAAAGFWLKRKV